ncbi:unnamed protein product [Moneuplotes crassus]|uniref:Uncharacterized protein n=1 Tax=Euplotes crassus TaxID=5936 RepID=A0AAD1UKS9_EUPCR|nr:unnamed protein product [Moneuplotes crassus]
MSQNPECDMKKYCIIVMTSVLEEVGQVFARDRKYRQSFKILQKRWESKLNQKQIFGAYNNSNRVPHGIAIPNLMMPNQLVPPPMYPGFMGQPPMMGSMMNPGQFHGSGMMGPQMPRPPHSQRQPESRRDFMKSKDFSEFRSDGGDTSESETEEESEEDPDLKLFADGSGITGTEILRRIEEEKKQQEEKEKEEERAKAEALEASIRSYNQTGSKGGLLTQSQMISADGLTGSLMTRKSLMDPRVQMPKPLKNSEPVLMYQNEEDLDNVSVSDGEIVTDNIIYGQFEKVKRNKKGYQGEFFDCVGHLNGKDYLIKTLSADILH